MRKNVTRLLVFTLIFFVIISLLQYGVSLCYRKRVNQKFTKIFNHTLDPQVMIFGSSVTYRGVDTRIIRKNTGLTVYNMGWDGLFFIQYEALINEYLTYTKNCKCIVIGSDIDNLGKNGLITRPDLFYAYAQNKYVFESLHEIEPDKMTRIKYLPGYLFTVLNKSYYCDMLFASNESDSLDGTRITGVDPILDHWADTRHLDTFEARYENDIYERLKACCDRITKKGIKVVILLPPVYKEGAEKISNFAFIKSKYRALANKDVFFLDLTSDSMCNSKDYFVNFSHFNTPGSVKVSTMLAEAISNSVKE